MSLVNNEQTIKTDYQFAGLFGWDSSSYRLDIVDASNLWLPDSISQYCYRRMFRSCSNLSAGPIWRSTSTLYYCYNEIYWGTKVERVKFNATSWYNNCDYDMTATSYSLSCIEVALMGSASWHNVGNYSSSTGIFIRPYGSSTTSPKSSWTTLERHSDGKLYYTDGTAYIGEDPFPVN